MAVRAPRIRHKDELPGRPARPPAPSLPAADRILSMQRSSGNQAVCRMLNATGRLVVAGEKPELTPVAPGLLLGAARGGRGAGATRRQLSDAQRQAGGAARRAKRKAEKPVIKSRTVLAAPNGRAGSRTRVGMGEFVRFNIGGRKAKWTASAGTAPPKKARASIAWELPTPGSATITATLANGKSDSIAMTVVAPTTSP